MKLFFDNKLKSVSLLIVLSMTFGLAVATKADALFPYDRSTQYGYFTNHYFDWTDTSPLVVMPKIGLTTAVAGCGGELGDGQAIPECIDTVDELVYLLRFRNGQTTSSSNTDIKRDFIRRVTGSAFIVYTMLGYGSNSYERVIPQDSPLWDELTARLKASTIDWTGNVTGDKNTIWRYDSYASPDINDVVWYSEYKNEPGITITSPSSGESYRLLRGCANPLGELAPLEPKPKPKKWSVQSTTSAVSPVNVGDTIKWYHDANSNNAVTQTVTYTAGGDGSSGSGTLAVGSTDGKQFTTTMYASAAGYYCSTTTAKPANQSGSGSSVSQACVTVNPNWSITPSTTVHVNDGRSRTATTSEVNIGSVPIGAKVYWTSTIVNPEDDRTTKDITFGYTNSNYWSGSGIYSSSVRLYKEETASSDSDTLTIVAGHAGKTICKLTYAEPQSIDNSSRIKSANACVTVEDITWSITPSTTVHVNDGRSRTATTSEVNIGSVPIGAKVYWTSTIVNPEDDRTTKDITFGYTNSNYWSGSGIYSSSVRLYKEETASSDSDTLTIVAGHAGKTICKLTYAEPQSIDNSSRIKSANACVTVEDTYELTPTVTINSSTIVPGDSFVVNMSVKVVSTASEVSGISWSLTRATKAISDNNSYSTYGGDSGFGPLGFYEWPILKTAVESSPVIKQKFDHRGKNDLPSYTENDSFAVGTKVCYALSVSPFDHPQTNTWRHSSLVCVVVGKKPKVQIWGGDVRAVGIVDNVGNIINDGDVTTSLPRKNGKNIFGSWSEYGVLAHGSVSGMASAGPFYTLTNASDTIETCKYSVLTFANTEGGSYSASCNDTSAKGNYHLPNNLPDVAAIFPTSGSSPVAIGAMLSGSSGTFRDPASKTLTLDGGTIYKNTWFVINAPDTEITITGDIVYDDTSAITDSKQIPQLVIIAKKINILDGVKRIDAWLIAKSGTIDTCSNVSELALRTDNCDQQLTINGPVIASKILLKRTYGSNNASDNNPAEIFNLRADAYLWLAEHHSSNDRLQTVYTTELPPRF